jgi:hypothetical protein
VLHPHLPHPHVHPDFEKHPSRTVPPALGTVALLAAVLITVCFEVAGALTGHAY